MAIHPYLESSGPIAIAHRGGALESPENTYEAFVAAAELGYRYLETDAQLTADGVVVAFHDSAIDRVSDETGEISSWEWDRLREVPINGTGRLMSILELLEAFPDQRFNLDAKSDVVVKPLIEAIAQADAFDRVCFGSFSDERLGRIQQLAPANVCTSYGPKAIAAQFFRSMRVPRARWPGHAVQVPPTYRGLPLITKRFVQQAHRDDLAVHVWTIDDEAEMHRLLDLGVDGIMTDRPTLLKQVFASRGLQL